MNVLDKMPRRLHGEAKDRLHQIWMAVKRDDAERAFDHFIDTYRAKYPKAVECLSKDGDQLLVLYDFPAEHWTHLRTTNPIESMFATVRLRTDKTKACGSRLATLTMVFMAEKRCRRLNSHELIGDLIAGIRFKDEEKQRVAWSTPSTAFDHSSNDFGAHSNRRRFMVTLVDREDAKLTPTQYV